MLKKNYEDYVPLIRERLINKSPVHGHKVTDREIKVVLKYFHKNLLQTVKEGKHVFLTTYIWFFNRRLS